MAFDAFRAQTQSRPSHRRRVTYMLSAALHGVLIIVGVAYSFWHVDELSPPTLRVTFMSGAPPPPPPPPPPAGGGGQKKKVAIKPKPVVTPKLAEIVQPRETPPPKVQPKPDDEDEDEEQAGVKGGVKGGTPGGTIGGTPGGTIGGTPGGVAGATMAPKMLTANVAENQLLSKEMPQFPPSLRKAGMVYVVIAKICVSRTGAVDSVTLLKRAEAQLDQNVSTTVKGWRYRPFMFNNTPAPFCFIRNFEFRTQ
jgi:protein TonB